MEYGTGSGPMRLRKLISMSRPPKVPVYRVGERFQSAFRTWPTKAEYGFGPSGHELTLFRPKITQDLIEDIRRGPAEFALVVEKPIFILSFRLGESAEWGDAPYCWHLQPESRKLIPSFEPEYKDLRSLLWVTLVGSEDGIIHAQRGFTLSPEFTGSLHEAIRSQAMRSFDPLQCAITVGSIFNDRSSVEDRLERASARTFGNS